jgi:hypothetical protein
VFSLEKVSSILIRRSYMRMRLFMTIGACLALYGCNNNNAVNDQSAIISDSKITGSESRVVSAASSETSQIKAVEKNIKSDELKSKEEVFIFTGDSVTSSQTLSSQFHTILVSENWDRPSELKALIHFPVKVKEVVYLSGKCDSKCTQFIVRDYVSLRPVLAALHNSWTAEPEPGYEEYAPSPFGAMSKNSYGVWFMGDCPHVDEVVLGSSNKIESINVDTAGLAENKSMKYSVAGTCK